MIKVLHIGISDSLGGIESFLLNLYTAIDKTKIKFDFVASSNKPAIQNELVKLGGEIFYIPYGSGISYYFGIKKLLNDNKYDVVHIHKNSLANPLAVLAAKMSSVGKIILHSHSTNPSKGYIAAWMHNVVKCIMPMDNIIKLACSNDAARWLFSEKYLNEVVLINNAIDLDKYRYDPQERYRIREEFGLTENDFVIGNVGRMVKQKNQIFLLDALIALQGCGNVKLLICGDGILKDVIKNKIEKMGLSNRVILTGARTDIHLLLNAMDVFVMPSTDEGLGIAAVEAQANGLPCVVSKAIPEECNITDSFIKVKSDIVDDWVNAILRNTKRNNNAYMQCFSSGYSIKDISEKMMLLYLGGEYF